MPCAAAATSSGWSGRQPGEVTTRSTGDPAYRATASVARAEARRRRGRQDLGALVDRRLGWAGVDDGDVGAALPEGVGGRETADAQPGDEDPQARQSASRWVRGRGS
jgi:hypothetical protein